MMSPYAFHQFWLNVEDEKVGELLRIFTFLPREEIEELEARHRGAAVPAGRRSARWPTHVTTFVHGADETGAGQGRGRGAVRRRRPAPSSASARSERRCARPAARGSTPPDGLPDRRRPAGRPPGSPKSKGEARRTVGDGGAYLNNERVTDPEHVPTDDDLLAGRAGWCCVAARSSSPGVEVVGLS